MHVCICVSAYLYVCVWMCVMYVWCVLHVCMSTYVCGWSCLHSLCRDQGETLGYTTLPYFMWFASDRISHWTWSLLIFWLGWQLENSSDPPVSPPHTQALELQAHIAMSDFYMTLGSKLKSLCVHSKGSHLLRFSSLPLSLMLMHTATS